MVLDLWVSSEHMYSAENEIDDAGGVDGSTPRFRVAFGNHDILLREIGLEFMRLVFKSKDSQSHAFGMNTALLSQRQPCALLEDMIHYRT